MVPSSASLRRNRLETAARVFSLNVNRVLLTDTLALRVNGSFQHDGFVRKPSGTDTVRYNGMVPYQPFRRTTHLDIFRQESLQLPKPGYRLGQCAESQLDARAGGDRSLAPDGPLP